MHQHCPLILFELTLHVSNYLVCGFVHLGLSNVHNMNFAHFTNYINNRWNCSVYMVQDFRCVHGTRLPVCTWYKTSGVYMVQDFRCVHGTILPVCTWYKTSGVYMVQDFRCVHGTRLPVCTWYKTSGVYMVQDMSKQIYVPPLKDTASPKTAVC
jgi:hypothetical protein